MKRNTGILIACFLFVVWCFDDRQTYRKTYSIDRPYQDSIGGVNLWHTVDNAVVTEDSVSLTPDTQSKKGSIWLLTPVQAVNWKVRIKFKVYGSNNALFGDGFAFWYIQSPLSSGPVFGSHDYFKGLSIIFDTYSNQNDAHSHQHPYISAHVNDGFKHYDHDKDGTHTQTAGCSAHLRGKDVGAEMIITYFGHKKSLMVETLSTEKPEPNICFTAEGVHLPTNYYFGLSAATGDLSDNHEILSFKFYDLDGIVDQHNIDNSVDRSKILPRSENEEKARKHAYGYRESYTVHIMKHLFKVLAFFTVIVGVVIALIKLHQKRQAYAHKRFY